MFVGAAGRRQQHDAQQRRAAATRRRWGGATTAVGLHGRRSGLKRSRIYPRRGLPSMLSEPVRSATPSCPEPAHPGRCCPGAWWRSSATWPTRPPPASRSCCACCARPGLLWVATPRLARKRTPPPLLGKPAAPAERRRRQSVRARATRASEPGGRTRSRPEAGAEWERRERRRVSGCQVARTSTPSGCGWQACRR